MTPSSLRPILSIFLMTFAASAVAEENDPPATNLELTTLATATALSCNAVHSFSSQLRVCDAEGCTTMDVTELPVVSFAVEAGQSATLTTSVAYEVDGVVFGSSETHDLDLLAGSRFDQTVAGSAGCMRSVYYQLEAGTE